MTHVVIAGAGIVGVSAGIWLRRAGAEVTLVDRAAPGQGTSFGNAGVLAACSMVPVTAPGLLRKAPRMLLNPEFPLFVRWRYLARLAPWLLRYLGHANDADTRRIAAGLAPIVADSLAQHRALTEGLTAGAWIAPSDYTFAYATRAAFEADAYTWDLRRAAGFVPRILEGCAVQAFDPSLSPAIQCLAVVGGHGFVRDPGGYVATLAQDFTAMGGRVVQAGVQDFDLSAGRIRAVATDAGTIACDGAVLATGVWSKPLMRKLGLAVPLESERGYHIVYKDAVGGPKGPVMVASGKFVATPMAAGLRCAGVVEFGGLEGPPSRAPFDLMRRKVREAFPDLRAGAEVEWMGHRPAPADSLPLIGEVGTTGIFAAFGHHHIGLTAGPKTGRLIAALMTGQTPGIDMAAYAPDRFARGAAIGKVAAQTSTTKRN